ncbi:DUF192 domain-containing protein [Patescibacteria group bacterium]
MFKQIFLPILATIAFIILVGFLSQSSNNSNFNLLSIASPSPTFYEMTVGETKVDVEIAKTQKERQVGLSNRSSLDENKGMLFVFEKNVTPVFWMKDTQIALDLIWIKDGMVIDITKNVQPEPGIPDDKLTRYNPDGFVDYVLEVNGGFSDKYSLKIGEPVQIPPIP